MAWNDGKSTPQVFIQYHETWEAHTGHYWLSMNLYRLPEGQEKQTAEADQLSQAMSYTEI